MYEICLTTTAPMHEPNWFLSQASRDSQRVESKMLSELLTRFKGANFSVGLLALLSGICADSLRL